MAAFSEKEGAVCRQCAEEVNTKYCSTSGLWNHLAKHPTELSKAKQDQKEERRPPPNQQTLLPMLRNERVQQNMLNIRKGEFWAFAEMPMPMPRPFFRHFFGMPMPMPGISFCRYADADADMPKIGMPMPMPMPKNLAVRSLTRTPSLDNCRFFWGPVMRQLSRVYSTCKVTVWFTG